MTQEQYDRWKDFSYRMARCYPDITPARRARIVEELDKWFGHLESNDIWQPMRDWDYSEPPEGDRHQIGVHPYAGDEVRDFFEEYAYPDESDKWDNEDPEFMSQLTCCIRAGMDVAVAPSGGVLGFTVGLLRQMYDGTIPDWVAQFFSVPGPLTDKVSDDVGVWL